MSHYELVWLEDERVYAELIHLGAFFSKVRYTVEGIDYEVLVSNDEVEYIYNEGEDADFDYEN